jgi:glycosyltransferase involved in cell wall biosynthesis
MHAQTEDQDLVFLLYPGDFTFWKKTSINIKHKVSKSQIRVFEIENPSPVPLLNGVSNPMSIVNSFKISEEELCSFYNKVKPDLFHLHTLMGLPIELVVYLKSKGVKVVFTSHDYYGLCLRVNFINQINETCSTPNGFNCSICNKTASNILFLRLRNSNYILKYKSKIPSRVNKMVLLSSNKKLKESDHISTDSEIQEYDLLLNFYKEIFDLVDYFHFNSTISESIYKSFFLCANSKVISISHSGIRDNRKVIRFDNKILKIGYIGSIVDFYKGFHLLREVMLQLKDEQFTNWTLYVWGGTSGIDPECNLISYLGKYSSNELEKIFNQIDLLIVPSIWKETFSLISLEAISFGVPVLVTSNVGAKDIIQDYDNSFIIEPTKEAFYNKIKSILESNVELINYNNKINSESFNFGFDEHVIKIKEFYNSSLN